MGSVCRGGSYDEDHEKIEAVHQRFVNDVHAPAQIVLNQNRFESIKIDLTQFAGLNLGRRAQTCQYACKGGGFHADAILFLLSW